MSIQSVTPVFPQYYNFQDSSSRLLLNMNATLPTASRETVEAAILKRENIYNKDTIDSQNIPDRVDPPEEARCRYLAKGRIQ